LRIWLGLREFDLSRASAIAPSVLPPLASDPGSSAGETERRPSQFAVGARAAPTATLRPRRHLARQAIRTAGAHLIFLPKYSPDLNPIEQVFAKLKTLLRKKAARTAEAIRNAIGNLLDSFTPQECADYLKNAGSAPS
jgi:hypothetical protein